MAPAFPNLVAALIELENSKSPEALAAVLEHLIGWFEQDSAEHRRLRRIFTVWLCNTLLPKRFEGETFTEIGDILEVKTMLSETVDEWTKKWREEGMEQGEQLGLQKGLEKGREEGREEGLEQGLEKGRIMTRLENARKMLAEGLDETLVARVTSLSIDEVEKLKSEH
jgi:predicted transposase/invertase (TIGR01784 family)